MHAPEGASLGRVSLSSDNKSSTYTFITTTIMSESARKKQILQWSAHCKWLRMARAQQSYYPIRRAASAGPTPGSRKTPTFRTPGTGRTPRGGPATRPIPSRRVAPTTPHAIRALRERAHAARTPGRIDDEAESFKGRRRGTCCEI